MNMLATQNCNVFLPLWVVPSFCPPSAPWHNQPQQWAETPSCSREFGGLQASLTSRCKLGGKPCSLNDFCPSSCASVQAPELSVLHLGYYLIPCGFWRNTLILILGVQQEAGLQWDGWDVGCVVAPVQTQGQAAGHQPSIPDLTGEQQPPKERGPHWFLSFFLALLLGNYVLFKLFIKGTASLFLKFTRV